MEAVLNAIWQFANSAIGISLVAAAVLFLLNRLYAWQPTWKKFEGTVIAAVKYAEREIPDSSPNSGMQRLDAALKYAVRIYEATTGKLSTPKVDASLKEGIQIKHAELEAAGTLARK